MSEYMAADWRKIIIIIIIINELETYTYLQGFPFQMTLQ